MEYGEVVTSIRRDVQSCHSFRKSQYSIFSKPERMVRPKCDTYRAVARCWQGELADLPGGGNTSNLTRPTIFPAILKFTKPKCTFRSSRDAAKHGMGQCELTSLALGRNHSDLTGPTANARFGKPEIAIWPCCDTGRERSC